MSDHLYQLDMDAWRESFYGQTHPDAQVNADMRFRFVRGNTFTGSHVPEDHVWRVDAMSVDKRIYLQSVPADLFRKVDDSARRAQGE